MMCGRAIQKVEMQNKVESVFWMKQGYPELAVAAGDGFPPDKQFSGELFSRIPVGSEMRE